MQVLMGHICFFVQPMPSHGRGSGGRVTRRLGKAKAGHISYPSLFPPPRYRDRSAHARRTPAVRPACRPSCLPPCISLLNRPRLLVFPVSFLPSPAPSNFPHPFPLDKFFWHETPPAGVEIGEEMGKDLRVQTIRPPSLLFCPFFLFSLPWALRGGDAAARVNSFLNLCLSSSFSPRVISARRRPQF